MKDPTCVVPGSSRHTVGSRPCCSTVFQPEGRDRTYTGNNLRGTSCSRPGWRAQRAPRAYDRSHTPLFYNQTWRRRKEKKRKDRTCSIQVCCSNKIKRWRRVDADHVTSALSELVLVVHTDHLGLWSVFRAQRWDVFVCLKYKKAKNRNSKWDSSLLYDVIPLGIIGVWHRGRGARTTVALTHFFYFLSVFILF